jgi:hypothetical protein
LAFFAARFSFRVLPGFFTLIFCGDLLDTTVLPHNVRMVRSLVGPAGTPAEAQPAPPPRADLHPEQAWSDGHVISLTPIAPTACRATVSAAGAAAPALAAGNGRKERGTFRDPCSETGQRCARSGAGRDTDRL